jgi:hypothetical protein
MMRLRNTPSLYKGDEREGRGGAREFFYISCFWGYLWRLVKKNQVEISVADPDHFDVDPDQTSKTTGSGSWIRIRIMLYIKFSNKILLLENGL